MNNTDRLDWINNNESLYRLWISSQLSKRKFIKKFQAKIDRTIYKVSYKQWSTGIAKKFEEG